jgi:hypothetical protein
LGLFLVNRLEEKLSAMHAVRYTLPFQALLLLLLSSFMIGCVKEDFALPDSCECGNEAVESLSEHQGTIFFNAEINKYTIIEEEVAEAAHQFVYILCDLPAGYPLDAQHVIFSGLVKPACREPKQVLVNQQFFDIDLTKLKKAES